ncbi:MAG: FAD-dependent oxidoreductase [Bacteroidota bacterium]
MNDHCVIIGASHAGVNCAFGLRKEGWKGRITLVDADPELPYHRPPLSKTFLTSNDPINKHSLKSAESYRSEGIDLLLGVRVDKLDPTEYQITLSNGKRLGFSHLVLATGARPIIPNIQGLDQAPYAFPLRTAVDVNNIKNAVGINAKKVVIIGGGYIGLEIAASLSQLGHDITLLERENRILARVTVPEMSQYFEDLHGRHCVKIHTDKEVVTVNDHQVSCSDGSSYQADVIVIGVGIAVNQELAVDAGIEVDNGILVDGTCRTNLQDIYAIGDCTNHHNPHYGTNIRLESVQNATDQAKIAAANICGNPINYNCIPWFWSDQYHIKLQIVGLSDGFTDKIIRHEEADIDKFSIWYFKGSELLAVDAINNAKAYVLGTKFIKNRQQLDKTKLADPSVDLKAVTS